MFENPKAKMVCDTTRGDGGVYFYDKYLEWRPRNGNLRVSFQIEYSAITDIKVINSRKKQINIFSKMGSETIKHTLFLYKADTFMDLLQKYMKECEDKTIVDVESTPKEEVKEETSEDFITKLERLSKLHESGSLTDEEFKEAKEKLLKQ